MRESYSDQANRLGALALAVCDRLLEATEVAGLEAREPAALVTLAHYPGQSVDELRRTLGLSHSGAVRLVDRLESLDLVQRQRAGPGRTLALRLTRRGTTTARTILAYRQAVLERLLAALTAEERAAYADITQRLLAALTSDRASARRICRLCSEEHCERHRNCPVDVAVVA